tara:strand:+ start:243 stop:506 length:264 start_codon:yes stop_codon:yes gene_type:complete
MTLLSHIDHSRLKTREPAEAGAVYKDSNLVLDEERSLFDENSGAQWSRLTGLASSFVFRISRSGNYNAAAERLGKEISRLLQHYSLV